MEELIKMNISQIQGNSFVSVISYCKGTAKPKRICLNKYLQANYLFYNI